MAKKFISLRRTTASSSLQLGRSARWQRQKQEEAERTRSWQESMRKEAQTPSERPSEVHLGRRAEGERTHSDCSESIVTGIEMHHKSIANRTEAQKPVARLTSRDAASLQGDADDHFLRNWDLAVLAKRFPFGIVNEKRQPLTGCF